MKKKFILLLVFVCIFLTGCMPVQEMTLDEVINVGTDRKITVYNKYRKGYKYNLPKGLEVVDNTEYNEVIYSRDYMYYLYVDAVSYYNKIIEKYEISDKAYVSQQISYEDKYGYLEINELDNEKYFIEIMYNYAKIEVIVNNKDIKEMLSYAISLLSSISYNDKIIENMIGEDILNYNENEYNIFETASSDNNLIKRENSSLEEDNTDVIPDTDLIN